MAVNGIEIEVGQVWKTRKGVEVTVISLSSGSATSPVEVDTGGSYTTQGRFTPGYPHPADLVALVSGAETQTPRHNIEVGDCVHLADGNSYQGAMLTKRSDDDQALAGWGFDMKATSVPAPLEELRWDAIVRVTDGSGFVAPPVAEAVKDAAKSMKQLFASAFSIGMVEPVEEQPTALGVQVGGDHYKNLAIQPIEYIHANSISFAEGSVIKYVTRWRSKNGIADLKKALHFIRLLLELESKRKTKRKSKKKKSLTENITALEYTQTNNIPPAEGLVIALVSHWRFMGGVLALETACQTLDGLIELEKNNV